jgi:pimeloyl-ACP methyl ester carboxylesterase
VGVAFSWDRNRIAERVVTSSSVQPGVAYEDTGPETGFPVVICAGSPGSRVLEARSVVAARRHGLRLIGYDRPGYGLTPAARAPRRIADVADDVRWLASELGVERLAVYGESGGAAYALGCAALLPDLVVAASVLAPLGPFSDPDFDARAGLHPSTVEELDRYFEDRDRAREQFRADVAEMAESLASPDWWMERWGDRAGADPAHDIETATHLAGTCREGLRQGDEGWWADWEATVNPWGFDLRQVEPPILLCHGEKDESCPVSHGRYIASCLPTVSAHFPENEDHTTIFERHREESFSWIAEVAGA